MKHKALIKKLEKMFPEKHRIEHRAGSCFMEQMIDHFASPPNSLIAECDNADCWAKGDGKKWADNSHCDEYGNDCKACQIGRGLIFRQRYVVRSGDSECTL